LGEYHPAIMELAEGVDLLIHDAQYTIDEFGPRAHFGHSAVDYTVGLGLKAGVKKLLLFHHDPSHSDGVVDQILAHCQALATGSAMQIESAAEGAVLEVGGN
jgi:ribonuclease BN (tRNA processing enzyme)